MASTMLEERYTFRMEVCRLYLVSCYFSKVIVVTGKVSVYHITPQT